LIREPRFVSATDPWLALSKKKIAFYVFWQCLGVTLTVAISQTIGAIGFPVLIIALIPLRWKVIPRWFTAKELRLLDEPTAKSEVVLASLGGRPIEKHEEEYYDPTNDGSSETISTVRRNGYRREDDDESQNTAASNEPQEKV
jgi:boron transporter